MKSWTVEEVMSYNPCYERDEVAELFAGREQLTVLDVLELDIPNEDKMWLVLRDGGHVSQVVERIVTRAVTNYALSHPITKEWAERWLNKEDQTAASAADAADAAAYAARAADAVYAADADADTDVAVYADFYAAEYELQVQDVRDVINKQEE